MATTKLLQFRPKLKPYSSLKFFSSSTSNSNPDQSETPPSEPQQTPTPKPFSFASIVNKPQNPSSKSYDFAEAKKTLAEFRLRTGSVPSPSRSPSKLSFQDIFKKQAGNPNFNELRAKVGKNNSQDENRGKMFDPSSLSQFQDSFKLRPNIDKDVKGSGMVIGGSGNLPSSIFGKDMHMRDKEGDDERMRTKFLRSYSHVELGEKLKMLRSKKEEEKGWFSLHELNDRLMKVRKADEDESKSAVGGIYKDIKESLYVLTKGGDAKPKKTMIQRLDVLGLLGGTPKFMSDPPKEHLVEKFFHPDNMSSAEKMKLELQKVRDEFKMSESDCGSARVQVAQLTTKIKYLSAVLHKKDKHSRKGLQQMVQNRKKLLKYLRRTDWDSYCLVLSKLGLRDNPDYKF